jgi:ribosomal protein S18 acetylase RimI-like enzyme
MAALDVTLRQATEDDFHQLKAIELATFESLRAVHAVAGEPKASNDEELQLYLDGGLLHVACDQQRIVGFCGGCEIDGWLHIAEMDVHPDWQKMGIGKRLINSMLNEGPIRTLRGATLTTDRLANFNAPFYATLGFKMMVEDELPPHLREILKAEVEDGLDRDRRVAMRLHFREPTVAELSYRRASEADLPTIIDLLADDTLGSSRKGTGPGAMIRYREAFLQIASDPNQFLCVVEDGDEVVGTFQLSFIPGLSRGGAKRAQIEAVRVSSRRRGEKIGEAMFAWAMDYSRRQGCSLMQLTTDKERVDAHRFYDRLGFEPTHIGYKLRLD